MRSSSSENERRDVVLDHLYEQCRGRHGSRDIYMAPRTAPVNTYAGAVHAMKARWHRKQPARAARRRRRYRHGSRGCCAESGTAQFRGAIRDVAISTRDALAPEEEQGEVWSSGGMRSGVVHRCTAHDEVAGDRRCRTKGRSCAIYARSR